MSIEEIGILLTLLTTILGWSITAYYQKQIVDKQYFAEAKKEKRQIEKINIDVVISYMNDYGTITNYLMSRITIFNKMEEMGDIEEFEELRKESENKILDIARKIGMKTSETENIVKQFDNDELKMHFKFAQLLLGKLIENQLDFEKINSDAELDHILMKMKEIEGMIIKQLYNEQNFLYK